MGTDGLLTSVPIFVSRVFALPLLPDPKPQTPDPFSSLPLSSSRALSGLYQEPGREASERRTDLLLSKDWFSLLSFSRAHTPSAGARRHPSRELIITHKSDREFIDTFKSCKCLNKRFPYTCFTRESIAFPSSKVYYSHEHVPHSDYRRELQENGLRFLAFYEHLVSRVCLFHSIVLHQYHFQSTPRLLNSLYTAYSKLFSRSFSSLYLSFASQYLWVMMSSREGT